MKRRIYGLLAAVCLVLVVTPAVLAADDIIDYPVTGGNIHFDKNTKTVTGCDSSVTEAAIPNRIGNVSVIFIGDGAFKQCYNLTGVSIPDGVTSIGDNAFYNCTSLTSVSIPISVTSIGETAFYQCESLTSVRIPDGVTSIRDGAFFACTNLRSVNIPNNATSIGISAFNRCPGLTVVNIPDSVTSIGEAAFQNCTGLTDVYYDGTQTEYETKLRPNVHTGYNDSFLKANFHFKEGSSPTPPSPTPKPTTRPALPNTAASDHTTLHGTIFLLLAALTLTVWTLGRRKKDKQSN